MKEQVQSLQILGFYSFSRLEFDFLYQEVYKGTQAVGHQRAVYIEALDVYSFQGHYINLVIYVNMRNECSISGYCIDGL